MSVSYKVAARGVPVNEGLSSDADEEETFVAGVDEAEHRHRHPEGQQDGRGEAEDHPKAEIVFAAHFDVFIGPRCVTHISSVDY